jgi:hypothetical protein
LPDSASQFAQLGKALDLPDVLRAFAALRGHTGEREFAAAGNVLTKWLNENPPAEGLRAFLGDFGGRLNLDSELAQLARRALDRIA